MDEKEIGLVKVVSALACVTLMVGYALYLGIDGAVLMMGIAAASGLAGYEIKTMRG